MSERCDLSAALFILTNFKLSSCLFVSRRSIFGPTAHQIPLICFRTEMFPTCSFPLLAPLHARKNQRRREMLSVSACRIKIHCNNLTYRSTALTEIYNVISARVRNPLIVGNISPGSIHSHSLQCTVQLNSYESIP